MCFAAEVSGLHGTRSFIRFWGQRDFTGYTVLGSRDVYLFLTQKARNTQNRTRYACACHPDGGEAKRLAKSVLVRVVCVRLKTFIRVNSFSQSIFLFSTQKAQNLHTLACAGSCDGICFNHESTRIFTNTMRNFIVDGVGADLCVGPW